MSESRGPSRSAGRSAVLAGALWAAGVGGEILVKPQDADGSVNDPLLFGLAAAAVLVGSAFLVHAFRRLHEAVQADGSGSRAAGIGGWCSVVGAALLFIFSVVALVSGLGAGMVWEASFIAFALGMLLLLVGQTTLGLSMRRLRLGADGVWPLLVAAGGCIIVAIGVSADPWHDIGMFGLFGSWMLLGARLQGAATEMPLVPHHSA